ncbi:transposase-like protein [Paraphaeosphaeria sporulosa]
MWLCKICHQARSKSDAKSTINGTSYIRSHIKKKHAIDPLTGNNVPSTFNNLPESPFTQAAHIPGTATHTSHMPWEEEHFQRSIIDWTIVGDMSFSDVTCAATRGLLTWNRSNLLHANSDSKTTLSEYINKYYTQRQSEVRRLTQSAASKIAISVDIRTSSNYLSFLGVVAHFVNANYEQRSLLIAFNKLMGDHAASVQASAILKVIRENNFKSNFHCSIGDNAFNNDYQGLMTDPWRCWLKVGRNRYPTLFKMAADFLSIPSTSCECERCFSIAPVVRIPVEPDPVKN